MSEQNKKLKIKEELTPYSSSDELLHSPIIDRIERYEMIEGIRYDFTPSPSFNHQTLSSDIWKRLDETCYSTGRVLMAPMDVYFDEDNTYQPDIIFISNENQSIIKPHRIEGAPDLVAEILSRSTGSRDKVLKKRKYAEFGVKEYWLVDPHYRTVDQFLLDSGQYELYGSYTIGDILRSPRFTCINIDLEQVFARLIDFGESD